MTVVRKLTGDIDEFRSELTKVCSNATVYDKVGRLEVKGIHSQSIKTWLAKLGF